MREVKQSAEIEQAPQMVYETIEKIGRTCYQSEPKGDAAAFVKMLINKGHESVLEHVSVSMRVVTDRGISHEIVRHRLASYSQESTRYCVYKSNISVIYPDWLESRGQIALWRQAVEAAEDAYHALLQSGISAQIARSVLPTCLKTELVMTMNMREWRHFFRLRLAPAAHPQMRQLAVIMLRKMESNWPVLFEDIKR